jgi:hypothetical protein
VPITRYVTTGDCGSGATIRSKMELEDAGEHVLK